MSPLRQAQLPQAEEVLFFMWLSYYCQAPKVPLVEEKSQHVTKVILRLLQSEH
jgi:hypothetical protein